MNRILEARNVYKSYRQKKGNQLLRVVNDISLEIREGEILGLVGESGCGKSTLARLLLGIEKSDEGTIYWGDKVINFLAEKDKRLERRCVQAVFQQTSTALNPRMKVKDIIAEPLKNYKEPCTEEVIGALLQEVGLPYQLKNRYPHALSDGQKQRVAIARALALRPKCIIFDEATSSLDALTASHILELIKKLSKEKGIGGLFISHDLDAVAFICKRVLIMSKGIVVETMDYSHLSKKVI